MMDDISQNNSGAQTDNTASFDVSSARMSELENNWKRALADYKNLEKRNAEEKEAFLSYANATLLLRLLPVLDNLEMLEAHTNDTGLKLIIKEFKKTLVEEGVIEIEAQDKEFDAELMEAIEMVETNDDAKAGKVVEVISKGYLLKQKLLRPTRVKVGQIKEN